MPPSNDGYIENCHFLSRNPRIMRQVLEESTQTEASAGYSQQTDQESIGNLLENSSEDNNESNGVIATLSRLFSTAKRDKSTQTAKDPLTCETEKLAFDIIYFNLGKRSPSQYDDDVVKCLRHLVQKILHKHSITMNALMSRINLDRRTDLQTGFAELSDEIFPQNQITWSRIITFFAFGAKLAKYCADYGMEELIIDIAALLAHHAVEKLTPFLREHGGWATLCVAFPMEHDYEGKLWRSLVFTGVGLTAIATLLAFQRSS